MKKLTSIAVAALALSLAPAAHAVTFSASPGANSYPGTFYDWATGTRDGGGFQIGYPPSTPGVSANPLGNPAGQSFGYVYPDATGTFDLSGLNSLSFVWGSADAGNVLKLFNTSNTLIGTWTGAANLLGDTSGSWTSFNGNPLITMTFGAGEAGHLEFTTNQIAFEVGAFSLSGGVPEPSTWALMILGIGFAGAAMRRRQTVSVKYA